jgi:CBS domain-containing protein
MPAGDTGLWVMAGMAAMMAGMMNLPFTGMIFVLELSHDLNTLPVLLVSSTAAFAASVLVLRRSILTEKLARRGQHIAREYSVDSFELTRVSEVMDKEAPTIPAEMKVSQLSDLIARGDPGVARRQATLILDRDGKLAGIITRGDVLRALQHDPAGAATVLEAGTSVLIVTYPDERLNDAAGKMLKHNVGRLPVVGRNDPRCVLGYLGRSSILAGRWSRQQDEEVREPGAIRFLLPSRPAAERTPEPSR